MGVCVTYVTFRKQPNLMVFSDANKVYITSINLYSHVFMISEISVKDITMNIIQYK